MDYQLSLDPTIELLSKREKKILRAKILFFFLDICVGFLLFRRAIDRQNF